jgi:hypothetical protein
MTISIDAETAFDKIQHPFRITAWKKLGKERTYLNMIKFIFDILTLNIVPNEEKVKVFPLK